MALQCGREVSSAAVLLGSNYDLRSLRSLRTGSCRMCSSPDRAACWWLHSLAVGGISVVILSPQTVETESDGSLQAPAAGFQGGKRTSCRWKIKPRPAVCPEMRDSGMRQLLVMSPQAFQGYGSSPAVTGRAPLFISPPPPLPPRPPPSSSSL